MFFLHSNNISQIVKIPLEIALLFSLYHYRFYSLLNCCTLYVIFQLIFLFFSFHSDLISEESIRKAEYIELYNDNEVNKKFGDVINLANGQVEFDHDLNFRIVEQAENCIRKCWDEAIDGNNVIAFWSVYKIRHRDDKRHFRYEWKIMIRKLTIPRFYLKQNVAKDHLVSVRSFILRDQDYPEYFPNETANRQTDRMEKRIFNTNYDKFEFPFELENESKYIANRAGHLSDTSNLNTGEYYANGAQSYVQKSSNLIRFYERPLKDTQENVNNVHHHYFLNKEETPIFKTSHYEKVTAYPMQPLVSPVYPSIVQHTTQIQNPIHDIQHSINGYRDAVAPSQPSFHFPEDYNRQVKFGSNGRSRGPYDDNRESILEEVNPGSGHKLADIPSHNGELKFPSEGLGTFRFQSNTLSTPRPSSYNINTSPVALVFSNPQLNNNYSPRYQTDYNRQFLNQVYNFDSANLQNSNIIVPRVSFAASYPYKENIYSELDPIYHSSAVLVTPFAKSEDTATTVSQLSLEYGSDNDNPIEMSTENYQTTFNNNEFSETTPFNSNEGPTIQNAYYQSEQRRNQPDSINAQLPPPETGSQIFEQGESENSNRNGEIRSKTVVPLTENYNQSGSADLEMTVTENQSKVEKSNQEIKPSTKKTSWKPKRSRFRNSEKLQGKEGIDTKNVVRKSSSTSRRRKVTREKTTTLEPVKQTETSGGGDIVTTVKYDGDEPRTAQSIKKSISVHIGEKITVVPKQEKPSIRQVNNNKRKSVDRKMREE